NPVNLDGWHLSDSGDPLKWAFPSGTTISPGGFLLVWADDKNSGLHTNFKLSADGEGLTLSDPVGAIVDEITFEIQATDISQGRKTDGDPAWGYFTRPTPGATNAGTPFYDDFTFQAPVFNISGGFYDSPVTVEVKNLLGSGDLRYTIDGSAPISSSPIWGQPINISANTVVKARIFEQGRIPGPIITNTYFIGGDLLNRGLPVISLSTHPDYFFAPDSGLYVQSFKPDWEYPVHIEMYEPDGLLGFHHDAGVQIGGENAWILPEKLLNIYSRKQYGNAHFDYQLFPDDARTSFGDFILRTSGNDWSNTLFRDNMMQSLINAQADLDIQHFRHCIVFINGAYFGIHIITEKQDADYALEHHQIAGDSLDYIENNAEIKEGDAVAYQQMMSLADAGVQTDNQFQALEMLCDTKDYTDYIISQIFTANSSWGHNIGLFRKRAADGRFRWFPHDYDRGFDLANQQSYAMEWATATNGASWTNPPWATLLLRKMLENANYKDQFIRRFADHLYVTFHPSTINRRVEQLSGSLRNEIPYHVQRWAGTTSSYGNGIPSVNFWETEVAELKQFGTGRNAYMWSNLNTFFGLQGSSELTVQVSHSDHGYVRLHDIRIPSYPWAGKYFNERNFTLTAVPKPGFNFVQWEKTTDVLTELIPAGTNWKYHDQDTEPPITWNQNNFDDSVWASGNAPLGYGDGDESTTLNYGASSNQKTISYYFRYEFDVINPAEFGGLTAKMIADDGAVAYLNGQEIWRQNMPAGAIGFQTLAASTLSDPGENEWITQNIPAQFLVQGANVLAVEVHQASQSSSDLSFDFELSGTINGQSTFLSSNPVLQTKLEGNPLVLRAVFEPNGNCGILPDTVQGMLTLTAACSPYHAYSDVVVKKGASLIVEPGVEILMPGQSNLWVHGRIEVNGTANAPVLIRSISEDEPWGAMLLKNTEDTARLSHLRIENATAGLHRFYFPAAISAYNADLQLDHLDLTAVKDNPIFSRFSAVSLTNSNLKSVVTGDCINVKKGYARVENCVFEGGFEPDMDAIDYDGVVGGIVRNNVIHEFRGDNCDGLDIGEA
ncbi:MAG: CotH kinase family protein, partial [Saprospiraceae bacterium]|nr:CotH kinase family protein [Saprospiraceae bacterium]